MLERELRVAQERLHGQCGLAGAAQLGQQLRAAALDLRAVGVEHGGAVEVPQGLLLAAEGDEQRRGRQVRRGLQVGAAAQQVAQPVLLGRGELGAAQALAPELHLGLAALEQLVGPAQALLVLAAQCVHALQAVQGLELAGLERQRVRVALQRFRPAVFSGRAELRGARGRILRFGEALAGLHGFGGLAVEHALALERLAQAELDAEVLVVVEVAEDLLGDQDVLGRAAPLADPALHQEQLPVLHVDLETLVDLLLGARQVALVEVAQRELAVHLELLLGIGLAGRRAAAGEEEQSGERAGRERGARAAAEVGERHRTDQATKGGGGRSGGLDFRAWEAAVGLQ
jgi:hypothetical protein